MKVKSNMPREYVVVTPDHMQAIINAAIQALRDQGAYASTQSGQHVKWVSLDDLRSALASVGISPDRGLPEARVIA